MKKEKYIKNNIAVYQAKNGAIESRADSKLTKKAMCKNCTLQILVHYLQSSIKCAIFVI